MRRAVVAGALATALVSATTGAFGDGARGSVTVKPRIVLRRAAFARPLAGPETPASTSGIVHGRVMGPALLRVLGSGAADVLAPSTGMIDAVVAIPRGADATSFGLEPGAPGFGHLRGPAATIDAFAAAHPELSLELPPLLYPCMDRVREIVGVPAARARSGVTGRGVLVGVADSGLDVAHAEFRDAHGKSRVRWLLDLSLEPIGRHPALEERWGVRDANNVLHGAVFEKADLDELLADMDAGRCVESDTNVGPDGSLVRCAPTDDGGHGTHVTGIAAASGDLAAPGKTSPYGGIAPEAEIVFVRIGRGADSFEPGDFARAVGFMFDRADAERKPMVANFSLGSDFGPHDGTQAWEEEVASYVGPDKPGRAIVVAAGNSGSILENPNHQTVHVPSTTVRVPIVTGGLPFTKLQGEAKVWVSEHPGSNLKIGLESPDGEWIPPLEYDRQAGKKVKTSDVMAGKTVARSLEYGVVHGRPPDGDGGVRDDVPVGSRGALVVWKGTWPWGRYNIVLEGTGSADLYLKSGAGIRFRDAVRETTLNSPATHPSLIAVGSTVSRPTWTSIDGVLETDSAPRLDEVGGLPFDTHGDASVPGSEPVVDGSMSWFSSAGPNALGAPKPEISAPGEWVVSAMGRHTEGLFASMCPSKPDGTQDRCHQIDETHGVLQGTSMASPVVAGVVALLLQQDPTLTQEKIVALLQAGAHRFRGPIRFEDQAGPGEVDADGALDALERSAHPELVLPSAADSWLALSSDYVSADGSRPITVVVELRTEGGARRADLFEPTRLAPVVLVDGAPLATPSIARRAPGVYVYSWTPPAGLGGRKATFGATFDGAPIVTPKSVPIASDPWTAGYASTATGSGCTAVAGRGSSPGTACLLVVSAALAAGLRRARSRAVRRA